MVFATGDGVAKEAYRLAHFLCLQPELSAGAP